MKINSERSLILNIATQEISDSLWHYQTKCKAAGPIDRTVQWNFLVRRNKEGYVEFLIW